MDINSLTYQQLMMINLNTIGNIELREKIRQKQVRLIYPPYFFSPRFMKVLGLHTGMRTIDAEHIHDFLWNIRTLNNEPKFCPYCFIQKGIKVAAISNGQLLPTKSDHSIMSRFYCKDCKKSFVVPSSTELSNFYVPGIRRKGENSLALTEVFFKKFVERYLHYEFVLYVKKAYRTKRTKVSKKNYFEYACKNDSTNLMESIAIASQISPKTAGIWRKRILDSLDALVNEYSDSFESRRESFFRASEAVIKVNEDQWFIASVCMAVNWYYYRTH